jgi:DNA repair exonuclease SbcCD ATPase subunit
VGQTGRLERKVVDLEGQLASERKKLEHECDLREAKEGELSKFMGQAMIDRQEHLKLLRESAGFGVQMSQKSERMRGLEREVSELTARCREADAKVDALRVKNEALRLELSEGGRALAAERRNVGLLEVAHAETKALLAAEQDRGRLLGELLEELKGDSATLRAEVAALSDQLLVRGVAVKRDAVVMAAAAASNSEDIAEALAKASMLQVTPYIFFFYTISI